MRQSNESVRAFANRYRRAEKALGSVDISVGGMYVEESRGNRVLERARLSPENQRLVLIGAAYDLRFDVIVESLCVSFPEQKPAPQVFGRDGTPLRLQGKSVSGQSSSPSSSSSFSKRMEKGKSKGKGKSKMTFVKDHQQELDTVDENQHELNIMNAWVMMS